MNSYKNFIILLVILMFPTAAIASSKASLDLWKRDPFLYGPCGHCAELLTFPGNKNRADFSEYNLQERSGYYTINLIGPKGTAVTLYGLQDYRTDSGYLVIVKEDDEDIEITDLESFPSEAWTSTKNETGGNYSVFYLPHQNFKSLIRSIQWGKGPQSRTGN